MKTRFLCLLILVCCLSFSAAAQDTTAEGYKLRELSAGEYLDGIIQTMSSPMDFDSRDFPQLIGMVLFAEYPNLENESWEKLLEAYDWLGVGTPDLGFGRAQWNKAIIQAWLRENQIDLSTMQELQFADYDISVTPRDFDTDGVNEYLLDVVKGASEKIDREITPYNAEYVDYLVATFDKDNYQILRPKSLQWHGTSGWPQDAVKGGAIETRFEDINADGLPEWLVMDGANLYGGMSQNGCSSSLHIYGWREGQLIDLTTTEGLAYDVEHFSGGGCAMPNFNQVWDLANVDGDPAKEILQRRMLLDNWYCSGTFTTQYDWDNLSDRYAFKQTDTIIDDTQNCLQRQAEEVMWTGDYAEAIPIYEQALGLRQYQANSESEHYQDQFVSLNQYLRARLALAYVMTEQPEKAQPFIQMPLSETYPESSFAQFESVISRYRDHPFQACLAAYDVFTDHAAPYAYGVTVEEYRKSNDATYLPENIGCNAPKMSREVFTEHQFTTDKAPVEQIRELGTNAQKVLRFDLNNDGYDEWLIWLKSAVSPFFFAPDGEEYAVSQVELNTYLVEGEITTWGLPEAAGEAIIFHPENGYTFNVPPWIDQYDWLLGLMGGGGARCATAGRETPDYAHFQLWRMDDNQLVSIFSQCICRDQAADLFPEGEGSTLLDGGQTLDEYADPAPVISDLQFVWDSTEQIYDWPPLPPVPTAVIPLETTATSTPVPQPKYYNVIVAFGAKDYEEVAAMTSDISLDDEAYSNYDRAYGENLLTGDYYLRALALQQLGREQEAIEAFLQMIAVAPNETWKRLAMLYLEPV